MTAPWDDMVDWSESPGPIDAAPDRPRAPLVQDRVAMRGPRRLTPRRAEALIEPLLSIQGLGVAEVARRLAVSRPTLYKLLAEHGGVERYLLVRRLEMVAAALNDPEDDSGIGDLAERWGFCDIAHLSRAFRGRYGVSPTGYRRAARADV